MNQFLKQNLFKVIIILGILFYPMVSSASCQNPSRLCPSPTPTPTPIPITVIGTLMANTGLGLFATLTAKVTGGTATGKITYDFDCGNIITGTDNVMGTVGGIVGPTDDLSARFDCTYFSWEARIVSVTMTRQEANTTLRMSITPTLSTPIPLLDDCHQKLGPNSIVTKTGTCSCYAGYVLDNNILCVSHETFCQEKLGLNSQFLNGQCKCSSGYSVNQNGECEINKPTPIATPINLETKINQLEKELSDYQLKLASTNAPTPTSPTKLKAVPSSTPTPSTSTPPEITPDNSKSQPVTQKMGWFSRLANFFFSFFK